MKQETIADIVAEMRNHASGSADSAWYTPETWRQLCDRIEAADKRLRAALKPVIECDCKVLASRQLGDKWFTLGDDEFVKLCKVTEAVRKAQEIMMGDCNAAKATLAKASGEDLGQ